MSLHVLIAPDKFKGTLTARAAAEAIARGWRKSRPHDTLDLLPISDGGDGFGQAISALLHARPQIVKTVDAAHRPCRAKWWWEPKSRTAIIESANSIGLAMLPAKKFHPFTLDTFGLGAVIQAAARRGAKRCLIGIGGSATNDAGFGLARALGWTFLDASEKPILSWTELDRLQQIIAPPREKSFPEIIVAVDVRNPLLGAHGCTRIYGPQKGLRPADFPQAERCLKRLAQVAERNSSPPSKAERGHPLANQAQSHSPIAAKRFPLSSGDHNARSAKLLLGNHLVAGLGSHWAGVRASVPLTFPSPVQGRNAQNNSEHSGVEHATADHPLDRQPGAGAAGGLGFGLAAFLGARLEPGFALFARLSDLDQRLRNADLVITGEGAIDQSTIMGKGVGELARRCHELKIPCLALAGAVTTARKPKNFAALRALTDLTTKSRAMSQSAFYLAQLTSEMAQKYAKNALGKKT